MDKRNEKRVPTITRDTISWRLRDGKRSIDGVLSHDQISRLCRDFGLDGEGLRQLSRELDIALARELHLAQPELGPARVKKGVEELQTAIKSVRAAEQKISKAAGVLQNLRFKNPYSHTGMPNPALQYLEAFEASGKSIRDFCRYLDVAARKRLVFYANTPDKRRTLDVRRNMVCIAIFNFWEETGRKISYTTDPLTSERGGPLIDFVNAIVECITDPSDRLNGESIKTELDSFKASSPAR